MPEYPVNRVFRDPCENGGVTTAPAPARTDVLVVGAGPAGSAAAAWAARAGLDVVLADAAVFPRDKTCGDGLTPRAIGELERLGLGDWVRAHTVNHGLRAHGFGQTLLLPWPGGSLPAYGSAVARTELDDHLRTTAIKAGAHGVDGIRAVDVRRDGGRVAAVVFDRDGERFEIGCERLIVADGVRSTLGKKLGREWHRDTAYGVAARSYVDSEKSDDPWISSHLELRGETGEILSGYGWIFPLGDGQVNIGVGTLATDKRPANVALRPLMQFYADERRSEFELSGDLRMPTSALLPMGGAVSNVAGPNWALIGDAAACVNPLNGEGIDYGLEGGRLVVDLMAEHDDLSVVWPQLLREHYGEAFSIARRLAGLVTVPRLLPALGPAGMRSDWLMTLALRWMGNLVTDDDRDRAARIWRWAGRRSVRLDDRPPFS
jgi:geranylgeranyl reductase family protein